MFGLFSGRDREVSELLGAVESAVSGQGSLFLIGGEPGIGKTRLAQEVTVRAEGDGLTVLWGHCRENGGAPPFWPWTQILRVLASSIDEETLKQYLGAGAAYFARAVPEVVHPLTEVVPAAESEYARFALFDSVATFLMRAARDQPLMVVLDDFHAADPPSLEFLEFLAPDISRARMVVICAVREPASRPERLSERLAKIHRHAQLLTLGGLDRDAVGAVVSAALGVSGSDEIVTQIHRLTEGHPLFVRELTRVAAKQGVTASGSITRTSLPGSIRQAINIRLAHLGNEVLEILKYAAVLGRQFDHRIVAAMATTPHPSVMSALGDATTAGIVEEHEPGRHMFTHALFREVIYGDLSPGRRMELHRKAGETMEGMLGDKGGRLAEMAHHFLEAAPDGEAERAVTYTMQAGSWAVDHLAYGEAARLFEKALWALDYQPLDQARRCEILVRLGEARFKAGQGPEARAAFAEALDLARQTGNRPLLVGVALSYVQPWDLPVTMVDWNRVRALENALEALDPDEHRLRSETLARLAVELYFADPIERADGFSQEAVEEARIVDDRLTLARALIARHVLLRRPLGITQWRDRLQLGESIQQLTSEIGDPEIRLQGKVWYLQNLLEAGEVNSFDQELEVFSQVAAEIRQPGFLSLIPAWKATRSLLRGDFDLAERFAKAALEVGQRIHTRAEARPIMVQTFGVQQYFLYRERGQLADMEPVAKATLADLPDLKVWRAALALIYAETDRLVAARREFEQLGADDFASFRTDGTWLTSMTLLAAVCAYLADEDRASLLYERIRPYAASHVVVGWAIAYMGSVSHYLGQLAATMGRYDESQAHFDGALESHQRMGAAPWVARTQYHYAQMLVRRARSGDREQARSMAASALAATESLGMEELARRSAVLAAELENTDTSPADGPGEAGSRMGARTIFRREGEYWTIVFGGETLRLKDSKGLRYLAELLRHPGKEIHVLDLLANTEGVGVDRISVGEAADAGLHQDQHVVEGADLKARTAYRRRIEDLEAEIAYAESRGEQDHAASLRAEQEYLAGELASALGLSKGRSSPHAERARVAVTNALRRSLRRLEEESPSLARHFEKAVNTGVFCSYTPDPPVHWQT